ncbi:WhiB family transcriptional regulator [Streptosporangium sp. NPDC000239]|uniref:WhiB family transcriptional regulator n=1 Tax=Streptosporangium sp. NPDC000239 TaxID=3154248 RepID=UPI00332CF6BB
MANLVRLHTTASTQHTVGVEPITEGLRLRDPSLPAAARLAVVERTGGRFGTVCTTDLSDHSGAGLEAVARVYADVYGAQAVLPLHPSRMTGEQLDAAWFVEGEPRLPECAYDPQLHTGPDPEQGAETPSEQAAREEVAREVCATCPAHLFCGLYAAEVRPSSGIWAGRTPEQVAQHADQLAQAAEHAARPDQAAEFGKVA